MSRFLILANPRTGSTLLANLLNSHPDIHMFCELLNDENDIPDGLPPLDFIRSEMLSSKLKAQKIGFKVFPEQIYGRGLSFNTLAESLGITHVIVLWRAQVLEAIVSKYISMKTKIWFTDKVGQECHQVHLSAALIQKEYDDTVRDWIKIGQEWPVQMVPIFVTYENLVADRVQTCNSILAALSCNPIGHTLKSFAQKQNPFPLEQKISNWTYLPAKIQNLELDVSEILKRLESESQLKVAEDILPMIPDREPPAPYTGWRYRVAMPYMSTKIKDNVYNALETGKISSATSWSMEMSEKLKKVFEVPVALACSNGFTALVLALQTARIGPGDEVIVPSLTMVAVPNACKFIGAIPVFADSSPANYNPGWTEIQQCVSQRTRAIIVAHTYGVPVPTKDLLEIESQCNANGWILIEDVSECVGIKIQISAGSEKYLGTFGHYACASLYANKMIHAGDGGFVLAKDPGVASRISSLANHGFTPSFHFVHFEVAMNAKINGLGAAVACGCLDDMEHILNHRAFLAVEYRRLLAGISQVKLMPPCGAHDTPWVFGVECESKSARTNLRAFLAQHGIETRDYFFPLHLQPAYNSNGSTSIRLPNSEKFGTTGFYLPTYASLRKDDLDYIVSVIREYFNPSGKILNFPPLQIQAPHQPFIKPGTFELMLKSSDGFVSARGHLFSRIASVGLKLQESLLHERWDAMEMLTEECNSCLSEISNTESRTELQEYWAPFLDYFKTQNDFEDTKRPWILEDLDADEYRNAFRIPTTTDVETLQFLTWLMKTKRPETVWEIGCWLGHATVRLVIAAKSVGISSTIYACDAFKWQKWMDDFIYAEGRMGVGKSFLRKFNHFAASYSDNIVPVEWEYELEELPPKLKQTQPDLVFVDITQDGEELEQIWNLIQPSLKPGKTILVFNGLNRSSIPFFTAHAWELKTIGKPITIAKGFLYVGSGQIEKICNIPVLSNLPPAKKLKFENPPGWTHHHNNAFEESIALLRREFHDDCASTVFIPAVEQAFVDTPEILVSNPWIGVIHSVVKHPEQFYTPDLQRFCTKKYAQGMKYCRGLFTLTTVQAEYLRENLNLANSIPIQRLFYPILLSATIGNSTLMSDWENGKIIDFVLIGSFARNWKLFFNCKIPSNFQKVLIASDRNGELAAVEAPQDIQIRSRQNAEDYEKTLINSVVFLALKYEGAANTIILECIDRNVPIVVPNMKSCTEYIGNQYPLLYDHEDENLDLTEIITQENIKIAIEYLQNLDKTKFQTSHFIETIQRSSVLAAAAGDLNSNLAPKTFDLTISICCYKRTHHLAKILNALWNNQDYSGSMQIILWNNNSARSEVVRRIAAPFIQKSTGAKSVEVIDSSENYYCAIRLALAPLMKSEALLICDDDVIPGPGFVSFFMNGHSRYPRDVLCVRGHVFQPHKLDLENPRGSWASYENLRFKSDEAPEQFIHFVHADACLIPKMALRECLSVEMPNPSFNLVDDYWMSFVLNHKFNRQLRKLSTARSSVAVMTRTEDSDTVGLALHTKPEVREARIQMYIHHMLQGWPSWPSNTEKRLSEAEILTMKTEKSRFWDLPFIGFNVPSTLRAEQIAILSNLGVTCVRIGAVGVNGIGPKYDCEFSGFKVDPNLEIENLKKAVRSFENFGIQVVITLHHNLASPLLWNFIAGELKFFKNVVGYDIINEPSLASEQDMQSTELESVEPNNEVPAELQVYLTMIDSIREVDPITPIILEPSFWAHIDAVPLFPPKLFAKDSNLLLSFHFYDPRKFTQRKNGGRFKFPGEIPMYEGQLGPILPWNNDVIKAKFEKAKTWADSHGIRIFVGEFGVCREITTAEAYLEGILKSCFEIGMSGFVFGFGDVYWDAMNYEFGSNPNNFEKVKDEENPFFKLFESYILKFKKL